MIRDDVLLRRGKQNPQARTALPGKTVINLSFNFIAGRSKSAQAVFSAMKPDMLELMELGIVIVTSAGNDFDHLQTSGDIKSYPARWAASDFPLIVVSSVGRNFVPSTWSLYGAQTTVWAIGEDNLIANSSVRGGYDVSSGTSFGMLVLFLSSRRPFLVAFTHLDSRSAGCRSRGLLPVPTDGAVRDRIWTCGMECIQFLCHGRWSMAARGH